MRTRSLVTDLVVVLAVWGVSACSSSSGGSDNAGGDSGAPGDAGADTGAAGNDAGVAADSGASADSGGASDGGGTPDTGAGPTCAPGASCTAADKSCIGLVDNTGLTKFGLRMSQVSFAHPTSFSSGIVATTVSGGATPNLPACNLKGQGAFSWLLQFDTTAGTLTTGAAKPGADAMAGYSFDNETLAGMAVQPATMNAKPDASGSFAVTAGANLTLPIFLDPSGTSYVLLPLKQARITMGTLSSSQSCIGSYNAAGLDPSTSCQPDATHPEFIDGGKFDGFIALEDADQITIAPLSESLCVLLSGNAAMYGDGAAVAHCKRDSNNAILFKGDWCAATNMAASGACFDSVQVGGAFAASSVKIN